MRQPCRQDKSYKKLELKNGVLPFLLQRINRQYVGIIVGLYELRATDARLTLARFNAVVLHPSRRIGSCTVHITEL